MPVGRAVFSSTHTQETMQPLRRAFGTSSVPRVKYLLNGKLLEGTGSTTHPISDPATGKVIGQTPESTASELEACTASSLAAFESWRRIPPQQRARRHCPPRRPLPPRHRW